MELIDMHNLIGEAWYDDFENCCAIDFLIRFYDALRIYESTYCRIIMDLVDCLRSSQI